MPDQIIRAKQIQLMWTAGIAAVVLVLLGIGAWQVRGQQQELGHQLARIETNTATDVGLTLNGCQKGNELRRAVARIAAEQAARTASIDSAKRPPIDRDALTITPCRRVVEVITGSDPGPVSNFVDG